MTLRTSRRCASSRSLPLGTHVCAAPLLSFRRRCPLDRPWIHKLPSTDPWGAAVGRQLPSEKHSALGLRVEIDLEVIQ